MGAGLKHLPSLAEAEPTLTLEERRRLLLAFVASAGVCKVSAIPREYFSHHAGYSELGQHVRRGLLFTRGSGPDAMCAVLEELLPPEREEVSGVHRLPMFEAGTGERRDDCRRYDDCLDRWVKGVGHPRPYQREHSQQQAQCPPDCWAYETLPEHVRHEINRAQVSMSKPRLA